MTQKYPKPMDEDTAKAFEEINEFFETNPVEAQRIFDQVVANIKGGK